MLIPKPFDFFVGRKDHTTKSTAMEEWRESIATATTANVNMVMDIKEKDAIIEQFIYIPDNL